MMNPYESPAAANQPLVTDSAEPMDPCRKIRLVAPLLLATFLAIACISGIFAIYIDGVLGNTATVIPGQTKFLIWLVVGISFYGTFVAALTMLMPTRWFRSRLIQATGWVGGLCFFIAAAQVIEPMEPYNQPHSRWMTGVLSLSLGILFAIICRSQYCESEDAPT